MLRERLHFSLKLLVWVSHTCKMRVLAQIYNKRFMISNKALFSINSAPMLTSFLEKSFVRYHEPFVIKFLPEPSFYMCGLRENKQAWK